MKSQKFNVHSDCPVANCRLRICWQLKPAKTTQYTVKEGCVTLGEMLRSSICKTYKGAVHTESKKEKFSSQ